MLKTTKEVKEIININIMIGILFGMLIGFIINVLVNSDTESKLNACNQIENNYATFSVQG